MVVSGTLKRGFFFSEYFGYVLFITFQSSVTNVQSIRAMRSVLSALLQFTLCHIICGRSRSSVVGIATRLTGWRVWGSSPGRDKISLLKTAQTGLEPTRSPIKWVSDYFFGVKLAGASS